MPRRAAEPSPVGRLGWFVRLAWLGPAALTALFLAFLGGLLWLMQNRTMQQERTDLDVAAADAQKVVRQRLLAAGSYLTALAGDVARGTVAREKFDSHLTPYLADHPEMTSVLLVDDGGITRWAAPEAPNRELLNEPVAQTASLRAGASARREGRGVFSDTFISVRNEPTFDLHVPIPPGSGPGGTLVARFSCEGVLRHMLPRETIQKHHLRLADADGSVELALPRVSEVDPRLTRRVELVPPGGLCLHLTRYGAGFWGTGLTLLVLLCVALVVGMAMGMWMLNLHIARRARAEEALRAARDELADRVRERTSDLEQANWRLQAEIAERQIAQEQARQRQEQLAHVSRVTTLGEMAAGLAHELNQPLGAIASFTEGCTRLIEAGEADMGELHDVLEETSQQAKRAGRIIHRLRALVAKEQPQRAPADVRQLTMEVVDLLAMDFRQEQIEFDLRVEDDLPPVLADRIQIQQVLLNLMRNAVDSLARVPASRRRLSVHARRGAGGMVEILLRDTGSGCDAGTLAKMFDAFYTTKKSGIGMGLSISRSIIEAHGGKLWAEQNDDGGLTFRFALPTADGEDHASEPDQ